jgi:hypothetical protein
VTPEFDRVLQIARAEGIIYLRGFCGPLHYGTRRNGRIWHAGQSTR